MFHNFIQFSLNCFYSFSLHFWLVVFGNILRQTIKPEILTGKGNEHLESPAFLLSRQYAVLPVCQYAVLPVCQYDSTLVCQYTSMPVCCITSISLCQYAVLHHHSPPQPSEQVAARAGRRLSGTSLHCTSLFCTYFTVLHCTSLCFPTLYCTLLYFTAVACPVAASPTSPCTSFPPILCPLQAEDSKLKEERLAK